MNQTLAEKVAVITGGGSGIGYATAQRFASAGARVVLVGRNIQRLDEAVQRIGNNATAISTDVSDEQQVKQLFDQLKQVDLLVTCAGGALFGSVEAIGLPLVRELFATRFFGQLAAAHYAVPKMPSGGVIIFCSGVADIVGLPFFSAGTAIDGAINAMTRSLAVELGPRGIRVNAISPGLIDDTNIQTNMSREQLEEFTDTTVQAIPLKRMGRPNDVADAAYFLATCQYVSGLVIEVDGGWSAT
ncbi:oxidoreductase [Nostocales cyanobacterium HT-58-2]|nr:oxidoreductase [Nostocales cyanobacterium HT-58-2]